MYNVEVGHRETEQVFDVIIYEDEELWSLINYIRSNPELEFISLHKQNAIIGLENLKDVILDLQADMEDIDGEEV